MRAFRRRSGDTGKRGAASTQRRCWKLEPGRRAGRPHPRLAGVRGNSLRRRLGPSPRAAAGPLSAPAGDGKLRRRAAPPGPAVRHLQESSRPRRGRGACRPALRARGTGGTSPRPREGLGGGRPRGDPAQPPPRLAGIARSGRRGAPTNSRVLGARGRRAVRGEGPRRLLPTGSPGLPAPCPSSELSSGAHRPPGPAERRMRARAPSCWGCCSCWGRRGPAGAARSPEEAADRQTLLRLITWRSSRSSGNCHSGESEAAALGPAGLHPGPQGGRRLLAGRAESG